MKKVEIVVTKETYHYRASVMLRKNDDNEGEWYEHTLNLHLHFHNLEGALIYAFNHITKKHVILNRLMVAEMDYEGNIISDFIFFNKKDAYEENPLIEVPNGFVIMKPSPDKNIKVIVRQRRK